ncbi:MAG: ABC transporter ATP-binding protein [Proteobacteria bacterium]|nr:MAG: ABC transporter ATP-binding protein [Pseudomonadota bacterium]
MANPLLAVRDLKVEFALHEQGIVRAVDGVSFTIRQGSTTALVGESGSGKSVIAQAIMGILPKAARITGGEILFYDPEPQATGDHTPLDIARLDPDGRRMRAIRGGRISIIFQEPMTSLSPLHTVGDQVTEAIRLHRDVSKVEARELAQEMLDMVRFPDPRRALDTYPFELSGGLRQRAMISMALVCRPALLIADEPTTALDVTIQAQILKLVKDLQGQLGMTVLLITHDLGVVANMAEDVIVIYHGNVMERGSLNDIFSDPQHPYLKALMLAVPRMGMADGERLTPIRDSTHAGGYLAERAPWPAGADDNGPLLRVQHLSKCFGIRKGSFLGVKDAPVVQALDDVSFDIEHGECLGLVGESGCGKTTLSKIIMRAIDPDAGEVHYNDRGVQRSLLALSDKDLIAFRRKIQFIFQDPFGSLNPRMTIYNIINEPLVIHGIGDRDQRMEIVKELMQHVGLDPRFLSRYPHSFSGGQRQRIGIARALALNPDLLICDEPVSALDVSVQAQILNLLKDLQAELGLTYLFISHNLAVVDYMADRIAVMCAGHLVEIAPRETLFDNPIHPYTKALLAAVLRPDLNHRLDFSALMEGKVSDPRAWPDPFGANGTERPDLLDLGGAHFVRAHRSLLAQAPA